MKNALTIIIVYFFIVVISLNKALAQQNDRNGVNVVSGSIVGNVIDSLIKVPVEFATIALYSISDLKKPVDGTITDEKGKFAFSNLRSGVYVIKVSSIGFIDKSITLPALTNSNFSINKKDILLSVSTKLLEEVTVKGQAALIEEKVDRLVYNAEKDITSKGGDASDVLANVPLLSVDLNGNVSLRGSQNVRVLINNKPSTILAANIADALKQIPAESIKSVEVITSPSAKYDAEGSGGIINIITKKNGIQGFSLNLDSGVGLRASNLGLTGNYRKGKLGMTLGGFGRSFYNDAIYYFEQKTLKNTGDILTFQNTNAHHLGIFGNYTLGLDYDLRNNESISAGLRFGTRSFSRTQDMDISQTIGSQSPLLTNRYITNNDLSNSIDFNIDYIKIFKPQQELSFSTLYSTTGLTNNSDASLYSSSDVLLGEQLNKNYNTNKEITVQGDFSTPIKNNQLFEVGLKGIFREVNSDYSYLFGNGITAPKENIGRPAGALDYNQNVAASYISYTATSVKKLTLKVGVRYELTDIGAVQNNNLDVTIPRYSNLVPSINISKPLGDKFTLKLGYNRRIQRPGLQQLNPNLNIVNPQNLTIGNPILKPELTDNVELYLSGSIKKFYLNASVFGRKTNNSISSVVALVDSLPGTTITTFQNIGKQYNYGTNLFGSYQITQNWSINGSVDVIYAYLQGTTLGLDGKSITAENKGLMFSGRLMTQISLKNKWKLQANAFTRGNSILLQGTESGFYRYSIGVRKDFKNDRGSLGLATDNFLTRGMRIKSENSSPLFVQKTDNLMINRGVRLTFSYKFGQMGSGSTPKKRTKAVENTDVKDGGGNNNN